MTKYALVINEIIDTISIPVQTGPGWYPVPDDTFAGDAYYNGVVYNHPGQFYNWSTVSHSFVFDQASFDPVLTAEINSYRDIKTVVTVSYNNGSTTYNVLNDDRTRSALMQKMSRLQLDPEVSVNFQTLGGFFDLWIMDLQGLFQACDVRQQKCFDAAQHVMETHATTPYNSIAAAKADFDTFLAS